MDDGSSVKIVDKFCYLGDMLSVDGDADAARICSGWFTFRSLVSFLTANDVSLLQGRVYDACVRSCMSHVRCGH